MKHISEKIGLVILFFVSFGIFLYLSFPYGVLKEALSSQVQVATGVKIRIDELGPSIPFGFKATGVDILGSGGAKVTISKVSVSLSVLQFFLFRLGVSIDVEAANKGYLDADVGFPIFKLISGSSFLPSNVSLEAKSFPLDGLVSYALKQAASGDGAGAVAGPIIAALGFRGSLDGNVKLKLDPAALSQSSGNAALRFTDAALLLSDPSIGLPDQVFKSALIKADMAGGAFKIDPTSRFSADELELGVDGKINLKNSVPASDLDLKVLVKLSGGLQEKFGWVMDGLSGGASKGGQLNLQVRGTVASPVTAGM